MSVDKCLASNVLDGDELTSSFEAALDPLRWEYALPPEQRLAPPSDVSSSRGLEKDRIRVRIIKMDSKLCTDLHFMQACEESERLNGKYP